MEKHILVVEDDPITRLVLKTVLTNAGYRVTDAEDGSEGVAALSRIIDAGETVDLVVTDIMMPNLSGLDLIDEMRRMGIDCPVFAVTAHGEKRVVVDLLRRGCADFIDKPVDSREMVERVRGVLEAADRSAKRRDVEGRRQDAIRRRDLADMRADMDAAVAAYRSLIHLRTGAHRVEAACFSRPHSRLGGDYVGIRDTPVGSDILVADVSGHDMGAAFHTVLIDALFTDSAGACADGPTFFRRLNRKLLGNEGHERMATALLLRIDLEAGRGEAVCAGHPPFIRHSPGGWASPGPERLRGDVLGVFDTVSFVPIRFDVGPGDRFFLFTDGVTGVTRLEGPEGRPTALGGNGLKRLLAAEPGLPLDDLVARVGRAVVRYGGYAVKDDILLAGIEIPEGR